MVTWMMNGLVGWLGDQVDNLLSGILTFLTSSMFLSPDVTVLPQVQTLAGKSTMVVNACAVLALLAAAAAIMLGDSLRMQYGLKDLLPRFVVGMALSNLAVPVCAELISVANALIVSMVGTAAPTSEAVSMARTHVAAALGDPATAIIAVILGLLAVGLLVMLAASWIVRVVSLVILAGIAPAAMFCYATPWTQPVATLWWRATLGCLAIPAAQAVVFATGIQMLTDPRANLPVLLGINGSDIVNLLLVIVLLWTTVKIPNLIRRYVIRGQGGVNVVQLVLRTVAIQSISGHLPFVRKLTRGRR